MKLMTIKTFDNLIDAYILRGRLDSEGIDCYLFDENIVSIDPLYNIAVGGIKLKINPNDCEKVNALLLDIKEVKLTNKNEEIIACPNCESSDLIHGFNSMKTVGGVLSAFVSFIFMTYPIYCDKVYKCKKCSHEFKAGDTEI